MTDPIAPGPIAPDLVATYRLQLGPDLDFAGARALVPYLQALGVSHLYLSPVMQARAGSTHGYDAVDPTRISEDLGGEDAFRALARSGLAVIVDFVPNHMAAVDENRFWRDQRTKFFDIDPVTGHARRFFDIDELAGVRVEDPEVFDATHAKVLELIAEHLVDGLRIDHVDGLAAPGEYLHRLRAAGVDRVWVEKILEPGEPLRRWPVEGTTGYEFLNDVMALFVDSEAEPAFTALARDERSFADVASEAKLEQARTTFAREVEWLHRIDPVPSIAEALAGLPVYRTYVDPRTGSVDALDREFVANLQEPLRAKLTLDEPAPPEFVVRFQQTSGSVMAKGVEDTSFYRYVRLVALNEVGGDPGRFGHSVADFHDENARRLRHAPRSLLASQTHDTKRSLDVRSRIVALTAMPDEWAARVTSWHTLNQPSRREAPDWTDELFVYQTLVGTWPIEWERLSGYLVKAMREAKRSTSWIAPNEEHERAVLEFTRAVTTSPAFLDDFEPFVADVALAGERISLGQIVLRLTVPGVPDIYQGDELWDLSLVDPDNRRPVDWGARRDALDALRAGEAPTRATAKLFVTEQLLALRRRHLDAYAGTYVPLLTDDVATCAFQRGSDVVVVVPTRTSPATASMAAGEWRNVLAPIADTYAPAPAVYERIA